MLRHQVGHDLALIVIVAGNQVLRHGTVGFDRPDAVNARDRGDDDHVVAFQKRAGGRVAHPVDLFVDLRFLLDEGVGAGDVGFGLIIVVVADEVFDRIVGEEPLELAVELRREGLVGGEDDRGALRLFDDLGHGEGLAGAGRAQQNLIALALVHTTDQLRDGGRLIARRLERGGHAKDAPALQLGSGGRCAGGHRHINVRPVGQGQDFALGAVGIVVGHACLWSVGQYQYLLRIPPVARLPAHAPDMGGL